MSELYRRFKPKEGDQVQFLGVYVLKWPFDLLGEPTVAFVEVDDPLYEVAPDLLAVCQMVIEATGNDKYLDKFLDENIGKLGVYLSPDELRMIQAVIARATYRKCRTPTGESHDP